MNKIEEQILKNQRLLLWENYRKWDKININNGGGGCVEMSEIVEAVMKTNTLLNPKVEPTLPEKTKESLSDVLPVTHCPLKLSDEQFAKEVKFAKNVEGVA